MKWTLIFAGPYGESVQTFDVDGDPETAARDVVASNKWLNGYSLIAAVLGQPLIRVRDDAQDSLSLQ
jgi:hypothetical protein